MISLSLSLDERQLDAVRESLRHVKNGAPKAITRALNRALEGARTDAVRAICREYQIKPSDVRRTFRIRRASPGNLVAQIISVGGATPLIKFNVSPKTARQKGVKVAARRKVVAGVGFGSTAAWPYSFIAKVGQGHTGVFTRQTDGRLPIKQKYGPSVPSMLGNERALEYIETRARERLGKELRHQIRYLFGGGR